MSLPVPEPGLVISYAYLWHAEYVRGQEEGIKDRPCAIVSAVQKEGDEYTVTVIPVTHSKPANMLHAIEIPLATKTRLGLDDGRSWAMVNEINRFVWPGPDLRPISKSTKDKFVFGFLPPFLFGKIKKRLLACASARDLRAVTRSK